MKIMAKAFHPQSRLIVIGKRPNFALGMGILAIFIGAASPAGAYWQQSKDSLALQKQPPQAAEDEKKAYRAIQEEPDANKKLQMLMEFSQEYPKSSLMQPGDHEMLKRLEEEYDAYYPITRETDFDNRAAMMIEFLQKYPKSTLLPRIEPEYVKTLEECSKAKKYALLEALAEQWLNIYPNNKRTYEYLVEATCGMGRYEQCGNHLEAIYRIQPLPGLVKEIYACYQKTDNLAKQLEWAEKLFKIEPLPALAKDIYVMYLKTGNSAKQLEWAETLMRIPEFDDDYTLRYSLMMKYLNDKNLPKAAEYAQRTLKSLDMAKPPDAKSSAELRKLRRACLHVIAGDLKEKGNCPDAISAYKKAIAIEKYDEGYYEIGLCLDKQKKVDEAALYYAAAELVGGELAAKAKARLETLYKALHNNTLIGIDKVYKKAKELLAE